MSVTSMHSRNSGVSVAIFLLCFLGMGQAQTASEYQLKAAYLYNFAKSAEWPELSLPSGAPLVIGVLDGDDEFIDTLRNTVSGKNVGSHSIAIRRVDRPEGIGSCHLIFFRSSAGRKRTEAAMARVATTSVLLVGEDEGFLQQGGMINLILKSGKIRFEVDRVSLERANIHLRPELFMLALGNQERKPSDTFKEEPRRLTLSTSPEYPEIARRMNLTGAVQLEILVRRDGTVKEARVIGGHPLLVAAVVKAVMGWRYEPAAKDSQVAVRFVFDP
jgi:TonB family protein